RTGIAQFCEMLHVLHSVRQLGKKRSGNIFRADRILRENRPIIGGELLPDLLRKLAGTGELLRLCVSTKRLSGILAQLAVDFSGREVRAREQDLEPDTQWRDAVGGRWLVRPFGRVDAVRFQCRGSTAGG